MRRFVSIRLVLCIPWLVLDIFLPQMSSQSVSIFRGHLADDIVVIEGDCSISSVEISNREFVVEDSPAHSPSHPGLSIFPFHSIHSRLDRRSRRDFKRTILTDFAVVDCREVDIDVVN